MPSRPRAADIAVYNAWADRTGQPRWGVAAAPAAKAAPKRRGRPGAPLPAQPAHGVVVDGDGGGWQRGTWWANRTEYARKTNGLAYKLRWWNSRTEEYVWRAAGRDYYSHNRQKFIINVPCLGYVSSLIANRGRRFDSINLLWTASKRNDRTADA